MKLVNEQRAVLPKELGERGVALVVTLLVITLLSLVGFAFLTLSVTENTIAHNEVNATRAFNLAEAGVALAKQTLRNTPDWDTPLSDPPTTTACPALVPASTGGCSFTIVNDTCAYYEKAPGCPEGDPGGPTDDTNNIVIIKVTGQSQTAAREVHVAFTRINDIPAPPAPLLSVGVSSNVSFDGTAFSIDGNNWIPPSDGGSPASQDNSACTSTTAPKYGIGVPNITDQLAVFNNLSNPQQDNITGAPPNPPWTPASPTPSIGVDTTVTQDQLVDLTDYLIPVADITYTPGTSISSGTLGTQAAPKIVVVDATGYSGSDPALTLSATTGAGILIVKNGTLRLTGNSQWVGIVIVLGSNVSIDIRGGGNKVLYGATLLAEDANDDSTVVEGEGNLQIRYSCDGIDVANAVPSLAGTTLWWKEVF
ncbi:MAG: PilX N-terminal domain-containing pilus assembly protein [candidate division NC10 bacterium]|nr:PilX N-terminal domain-containing pilus assembly protein [candidate division NC10 bacterium]